MTEGSLFSGLVLAQDFIVHGNINGHKLLTDTVTCRDLGEVRPNYTRVTSVLPAAEIIFIRITHRSVHVHFITEYDTVMHCSCQVNMSLLI